MLKCEIFEPVARGYRKEISRNEFANLLRASNNLKILWRVEEFFSVLAQSYLDVEEYLAAVAIRHRYSHTGDPFEEDWLRVQASLNVKLLAYITAARLYVDYAEKHLRKLRFTDGANVDFESFTHEAHDSSFEYRVMYEMRNYALHNDLPLGGVHYLHANRWRESGTPISGPSRGRLTLDPVFRVAPFVSWGSLKPKVRNQINDLGVESLDVKYFSRGFVGALWQIHRKTRQATESTFTHSMETLRSQQELFAREIGKDVTHLKIGEFNNDGDVVSMSICDIGHFEAVNRMRGLWKALENAQRLYVSTEIVSQSGKYPSDHPDIWIDN